MQQHKQSAAQTTPNSHYHSGSKPIESQGGDIISNNDNSKLLGNTRIKQNKSVDRSDKGGNNQSNLLVNTCIEHESFSDQKSVEQNDKVSQIQGAHCNNAMEHIDYQKSADIVKAVIQDKKCLRHININRIMDKCVCVFKTMCSATKYSVCFFTH